MKRDSGKRIVVELYTVAGVATDPRFMDDVREEIGRRLGGAGYDVRTASLLPYGDWYRRVYWQLAEAGRDLTVGRRRWPASVGGRRVCKAIEERKDAGAVRVLIGHSAGGVASVHAARRWLEDGSATTLVVQIGSPKCPVPSVLRPNVLYIYGVDKSRGSDPVTWMGGWGGWTRGRGGVPIWSSRAHAPGHLASVPLLGGHPHYFRRYPPYVGPDGVSNMEHTAAAVMSWLTAKLPDSSGITAE